MLGKPGLCDWQDLSLLGLPGSNHTLHWTLINRLQTCCHTDMETIFTLVALCAGNPPVIGRIPPQTQWCGPLICYLLLAWTKCWTRSHVIVYFRCHDTHVMALLWKQLPSFLPSAITWTLICKKNCSIEPLTFTLTLTLTLSHSRSHSHSHSHSHLPHGVSVTICQKILQWGCWKSPYFLIKFSISYFCVTQYKYLSVYEPFSCRLTQWLIPLVFA